MKNVFLAVVILLLLLGSILRLSWFWQPSFTGDEAGHMMKAVSVTRGITDFVLNQNRRVALQNIIKPILEHNHPPLEFLVLLPSVPFYPREFSARFIYVIISIITLITSFYIVYKIRGKVVSLGYLGLLATSSFLVWFSQMITFGLNLTGSVFLALGLLIFITKPTKKSLIFLVSATVFALLVSIDFLLFVPIVTWSIYKKKSQFYSSSILKIVGVGILLLALYYVPYIGYSFLPDSPTSAGFVHYRSYLTSDRTAQVNSFFSQGLDQFLVDKWKQFFSRAGVWTIWPWAIATLLPLWKKRRAYTYYLWSIVILIFILEIPVIPCCTVYLNLFGPLLLLAAEGIAILPRYPVAIIMAITIINSIQAQPILKGIPNPITYNNWKKETDRIREIGQLIKPCLDGEETYISTEDAWRARYYFGRPMLPTVEYEMTSDEQAVEQFLRGDLPQVTIIHIHVPLVSEVLINQLQIQAKHFRQIENHRIYFFKDCSAVVKTTDIPDTNRN